ncbi:hypothetical protein WN944_000924 [Citrus x changshan-huyou]|uniref:Uncharacterized protein n=1 Tax=Citrus x changshan-huyou TaxID=2935761 RepID=A0AAP0MK28_9ROSI
MTDQGSRFGPFMIINENDKDIISNNTTIAKEARRRSTFSPNSHGMSSNNPNKLMMLSNSAGINEDLLLSLNHSNDPPDGRQPSFNQSNDDSEDSGYMRDNEEEDGKSESDDSLVFEDGIDAE